MKSVRVTVGIEHRFVHEAHEAPVPLNAIAQARAYPVLDSHPLPDTDLLTTVWKVPEGAEMSLPEKCANKLIALGYAQDLAVAAEPAPVAVVAAEPVAAEPPAPAPAPTVSGAFGAW